MITDGPTAKTAVRLNNGNTSVAQLTTNSANSFSGGLILANNAAGTRLIMEQSLELLSVSADYDR